MIGVLFIAVGYAILLRETKGSALGLAGAVWLACGGVLIGQP